MSDSDRENLVETVDIDLTDGIDFLRRFNLPPLRRLTEAEARVFVEPLQVVRRFHALRLVEGDAFTPELQWKSIYTARRRELCRARERGEPVEFAGATVSELNALLERSDGAHVRVLSRELIADATLRVPSRTTLMGGRTRLSAGSPIDAAIEVRDGAGVRVHGFEISGRYRVGIHVKNGASILLDDNHIHDVDGRAVVVMGRVAGLDLIGNTVRSNGRGGVYLRGDIGPGLIQDNRIEDNRSTQNLTAGLVLSSRPAYDVDDPEGGERLGTTPLRLDERLESPHDLVVRRNVTARNASSGIYCDGVYHVYIVENIVEGNDKEGMCLDFGTIGSYVRGNRIAGNGGRSRQTDDDLRDDFVLHFGRMRDGSSIAKLPAVSIDNAAYNVVHENVVSGNFGGGVKTVRAGVRNLISHNLILDNNRGGNRVFHFCGIEFGNATPDQAAHDLDFAAAYENMAFRNVIEGNHRAGIDLADGCYRNDFFDNCIFGATTAAINSFAGMENSSVNNLSDAPSRGLLPGPAEGGREAPPDPRRYPRVIRTCGRRLRSWYRSARGSLVRAG